MVEPLISGGSLWAVVERYFHRVINNTISYYDQLYTIMSLCKHRLARVDTSGTKWGTTERVSMLIRAPQNRAGVL